MIMISSEITYAGIGSRHEVPNEIIAEFFQIGFKFAQLRFKLRSGRAIGCDTAFELGCTAGGGAKEIWRPAPTKYDPKVKVPVDAHYLKASFVHPIFNKLKEEEQALHARNVGIILGMDCDSPVKFVVTWTPDGAETVQQVTRKTGGTGTAIRLAASVNIPVFNFKNPDARERLDFFIKNDRLPQKD